MDEEKSELKFFHFGVYDADQKKNCCVVCLNEYSPMKRRCQVWRYRERACIYSARRILLYSYTTTTTMCASAQWVSPVSWRGDFWIITGWTSPKNSFLLSFSLFYSSDSNNRMPRNLRVGTRRWRAALVKKDVTKKQNKRASLQSGSCKRTEEKRKNDILGVSWASRRVSGHPGRSASSPTGQQQDRAVPKNSQSTSHRELNRWSI